LPTQSRRNCLNGGSLEPFYGKGFFTINRVNKDVSPMPDTVFSNASLGLLKIQAFLLNQRQ